MANGNLENQQPGWKNKLAHESVEFLTIFAYMAFFFGCFTVYRHLVLEEYHISYMHYGLSVVQALVLAKVVMLGDILGLGKRLEHKALIFSAIYKTALFTVWAGLFAVFEHTLDGLIHHKGLAQSVMAVFRLGYYELLSRCLVVFVSFLPFFTIKEISGRLGRAQTGKLLFKPKE